MIHYRKEDSEAPLQFTGAACPQTLGRKLMGTPMKKWKRLFVLALLLLNPITLMCAWFGWATYSNANPESGAHVDSVAWLPKTATDVCFVKSYSNTAYEFQIQESEFVLWAKDELDWAPDFELKEIEGALEIVRYTAFVPKSHSGPERPHQGGDPLRGDPRLAIISKGIFYHTPPRSNGGGTSVAYDRERGRGYCQHSPR